MTRPKTVKVDISLVEEIENCALLHGISKKDASKLLARELKRRKNVNFYRL